MKNSLLDPEPQIYVNHNNTADPDQAIDSDKQIKFELSSKEIKIKYLNNSISM